MATLWDAARRVQEQEEVNEERATTAGPVVDEQQEPPKFAPASTARGEFARGVQRRVPGLRRALGETVQAAGDVTGFESVERTGMELAQSAAAEEQARPDLAARVPTFQDIEWDWENPARSASRAADWFLGKAGESSADIALGVGGGIVGGVTGGAPGAVVGAGSALYPTHFGGNLAEIRDTAARTGRPLSSDVYFNAGMAALEQTALDIVGPGFFLTKMMPREVKKALGQRIGEGVGFGAVSEGVTESAQEYVGVKHALEPSVPGYEMPEDEFRHRLVEAGLAGAALGGAFGGVGGLAAPAARPLLEEKDFEQVLEPLLEENSRPAAASLSDFDSPNRIILEQIASGERESISEAQLDSVLDEMFKTTHWTDAKKQRVVDQILANVIVTKEEVDHKGADTVLNQEIENILRRYDLSRQGVNSQAERIQDELGGQELQVDPVEALAAKLENDDEAALSQTEREIIRDFDPPFDENLTNEDFGISDPEATLIDNIDRVDALNELTEEGAYPRSFDGSRRGVQIKTPTDRVIEIDFPSLVNRMQRKIVDKSEQAEAGAPLTPERAQLLLAEGLNAILTRPEFEGVEITSPEVFDDPDTVIAFSRDGSAITIQDIGQFGGPILRDFMKVAQMRRRIAAVDKNLARVQKRIKSVTNLDTRKDEAVKKKLEKRRGNYVHKQKEILAALHEKSNSRRVSVVVPDSATAMELSNNLPPRGQEESYISAKALKRIPIVERVVLLERLLSDLASDIKRGIINTNTGVFTEKEYGFAKRVADVANVLAAPSPPGLIRSALRDLQDAKAKVASGHIDPQTYHDLVEHFTNYLVDESARTAHQRITIARMYKQRQLWRESQEKGADFEAGESDGLLMPDGKFRLSPSGQVAIAKLNKRLAKYHQLSLDDSKTVEELMVLENQMDEIRLEIKEIAEKYTIQTYAWEGPTNSAEKVALSKLNNPKLVLRKVKRKEVKAPYEEFIGGLGFYLEKIEKFVAPKLRALASEYDKEGADKAAIVDRAKQVWIDVHRDKVKAAMAADKLFDVENESYKTYFSFARNANIIDAAINRIQFTKLNDLPYSINFSRDVKNSLLDIEQALDTSAEEVGEYVWMAATRSEQYKAFRAARTAFNEAVEKFNAEPDVLKNFTDIKVKEAKLADAAKAVRRKSSDLVEEIGNWILDSASRDEARHKLAKLQGSIRSTKLYQIPKKVLIGNWQHQLVKKYKLRSTVRGIQPVYTATGYDPVFESKLFLTQDEIAAEAESFTGQIERGMKLSASSTKTAEATQEARQPKTAEEIVELHRKFDFKTRRVLDRWAKQIGLRTRIKVANAAKMEAYTRASTDAFIAKHHREGTLDGATWVEDGTIYVYINPTLTGQLRQEVMAHEMGHVIFFTQFENLSRTEARGILDQYEKWLAANGRDTSFIHNLVKSKKTPEAAAKYLADVAFDTTLGDLDPEMRKYAVDFEEWFADEASKVLTKNSSLKGPLLRWFENLVNYLKALFKIQTEYQSVEHFVDSLTGRNFSVKDDLFKETLYNVSHRAGIRAAISPVAEEAIRRITGMTKEEWQANKGFDTAEALAWFAASHEGHTSQFILETLFKDIFDTLSVDNQMILERAAQTHFVQRQIIKHLGNDEKVLRKLRDPEKAAAIMYALWARGVINVGPQTQTVFKRIVNMVKKIWGVIVDEEVAPYLLEAIHAGKAEMRALNLAPEGEKVVLVDTKAFNGIKQALNPAVQKFLDKTHSLFVDAGKVIRSFGIPVFNEIADYFNGETGANFRGVAFQDAKTQQIHRWRQKMYEIVQGKDAEHGRIALEVLYGQRNRRDASADVLQTVDGIRGVLGQMYKYMERAGQPVGKIENYFPWVFDVEHVRDNQTEFVNLLNQTKYHKHYENIASSWIIRNMERTLEALSNNPDEAAQARYDQVAELLENAQNASEGVWEFTRNKRKYGKWTVGLSSHAAIVDTIYNNILINAMDNEMKINDSISHQPSFRFANTRILDFFENTPDMPQLAQFFSKDMGLVLDTYINSAVKRTEYTRRFGEKGEKLEQLRTKAEEQVKAHAERVGRDDDHKAKIEAELMEVLDNYINAMMGTHGLNTWLWLHKYFGFTGLVPDPNAPENKGKPISPKVQKVINTIMVYQNVRLLALATVSSLIDPIGIAVRTGDLGLAGRSFFLGMKSVYKASRGDEDLQVSLAKLLGTIDVNLTNEALGWEYGGVYMSGWQKKTNDFFFKFTLLEAWTRSTRIMAMHAGLRFLAYHKALPKKHSERWLQDLGLKADDIVLDGEGNVKILFARDLQGATAEEIARDQRVKQALFRFTDEAILRPNASTRPIWASDQHFSLIFHLKSFMYTFHDKYVRRVLYELGEGNYLPLVQFLMFAPAMMAAEMLRDLIQHGGDNPRKANWTWSDYMLSGIERSGMPGLTQIAIDAKGDVEYGGWGFESWAGPTVQQVLNPDPSKALPAQNVYRGWLD